MDPQLKDQLIKQYGGRDAFAQNASDGDFIWGISDLFGYQGPSDFSLLGAKARRLVVLSFFCKEFLQGGFASVIENLPDCFSEIDEGLRQYGPGTLADAFRKILADARDEEIDLADDDARWDYIENAHDFRVASERSRNAFPELLSRLREAVKTLE